MQVLQGVTVGGSGAALVIGLAVICAVLTVFLTISMRARRHANALVAEHKATTNRFAAVLNALNSAVLGVSREGWIVLANLDARQVLGQSLALPMRWPDTIIFADPESLKPLAPENDLVQRAAAGEVIRGEVYHMTAGDGAARRTMRVSSSPVLEDGELGLAAVLILDDVTEYEQTRLQREQAGRMEALGALTGGIAHDVNNLLAAIKYATQMSDAAETPDKQAEYREAVLKSIARGGVMTERLLAFARRHPAVATSRPLKDVLDRLATVARPLIEEEIAFEIGAYQSDLHVFVDGEHLETALLNLVVNARDAISRSGQGGRIVISARPVTDISGDPQFVTAAADTYVAQGLATETQTDLARGDGRAFRYVEISVSDDGPGMDVATKRRAVDPFFTTETPNAGRGLGLSVVYGFIQQAHGILQISSEPGQGTTIRMLLPRGSTEGLCEAPIERSYPKSGRGQSVLIVEDTSDHFGVMADVVRSLGYDAVTVNTSSEALELLSGETSIHILMTDIVMPGGLGGFRLAEAARGIRPGLPVLFMSGYAGVSSSDIARLASPVIQKPCPPGVLAQALQTALADRKATADA